jgi:hypothetical protein
MKNADYWISGFREFFHSLEETLPVVLDGAACREGWLHGEALRFFRSRPGTHFHVNRQPIGERKKADFAAYASDDDDDDALWTVAELKVLGIEGFQEKVLGEAVAPLFKRLQNGKRPLALNLDPASAPSGWGLIQDYHRLRSYSSAKPLTKLLILVLHTRSKKPDRLGQVLQAVDFGVPAFKLHRRGTKDFTAKAWLIGDSPQMEAAR